MITLMAAFHHHHHFHLLLQLIFIFIFIFPPTHCLSFSSKRAVVLPLKTELLPRASSSSSLNRFLASSSARTSKLPFHHNVTLTVSLSVGSPPQNVTMVLDTGSELSWLHCKKQPDLHSVFNPLASSSYSPIPCSSAVCTTRTRNFPVPASCDPNKLCHAIISYADFTSIEGNLAYDTFVFGSSTWNRTVFGCMDSGFSSNTDEDAKTTGLMGMNRGSLSFVTQMGFPKFSYCISGFDSSGILLLGDASFSWLTPLNYTPLVQISTPLPYFDRVAYTVQLEGIRVGNTLLALPKSVFVPDHTGAGQTMVDSGTQFTFLLGPVYTALKTEFRRQTNRVLSVLDDPNYVFQGAMDLCYRVESTRSSLPALPTVSLMFRGAEMSISGERLLFRVPETAGGNDSVYCFTFGNSDLLGIEAFVIGHHHQQNVWVEFDLVKSRVGFADFRCDLASQKLGLTL
ncbi:aspartic proteinase PCS1-like [Carica papaya]|uniref:aspartic proteinase PCS1-like n=1 Tax=Carica papaya TaxID=3649 RepID=UPI000B8D0C74|nr:aspartic proteinase PCS1-like [Carica papaya]